MYHLLETQLYMIPLWEWAKFTLPNWIFHPLLFSFPYFPTWFLFYSFTWLPFLEPVLGNSTYNSNPLHILPCIHIICHMYGLHGSLWLSILFSSNSVTWCSPANMPSILYAFILSLLPVLLCFFCCYFSVFFSFFAYHQCTFQEWTLRFPKKKKKKKEWTLRDTCQVQAESLVCWVQWAVQMARLWHQGHQASLCTSGQCPAPLAALGPQLCAPARQFQGFGCQCLWGIITSPATCHVADRVLVLRLVVRPEPLRWESCVQDIGPPETSWPLVTSISKSSPRDLHLNAKTQLHSMTSNFWCWTPHAKQLARQEYNPTHQQRGWLKS